MLSNTELSKFVSIGDREEIHRYGNTVEIRRPLKYLSQWVEGVEIEDLHYGIAITEDSRDNFLVEKITIEASLNNTDLFTVVQPVDMSTGNVQEAYTKAFKKLFATFEALKILI